MTVVSRCNAVRRRLIRLVSAALAASTPAPSAASAGVPTAIAPAIATVASAMAVIVRFMSCLSVCVAGGLGRRGQVGVDPAKRGVDVAEVGVDRAGARAAGVGGRCWLLVLGRSGRTL